MSYKKQFNHKVVATMSLLIGGAIGGGIWNAITAVAPTDKPEMLQLMLPIIIIDVMIVGLGIFTIKKI